MNPQPKEAVNRVYILYFAAVHTGYDFNMGLKAKKRFVRYPEAFRNFASNFIGNKNAFAKLGGLEAEYPSFEISCYPREFAQQGIAAYKCNYEILASALGRVNPSLHLEYAFQDIKQESVIQFCLGVTVALSQTQAYLGSQ
jgi:hypothetical protein